MKREYIVQVDTSGFVPIVTVAHGTWNDFNTDPDCWYLTDSEYAAFDEFGTALLGDVPMMFVERPAGERTA